MIRYEELKDYTVIVTGGTRGIGRAISEAFLDQGSRVIALYRGDEESAARFREARQAFPLEVQRLDIADAAAVEAFFARFDRERGEGALDALVNNAGIRRDNVVGMMPTEDWDAVLRTNLTGTYLMSKMAALRMLSKRFGRVINITSPSGKYGFMGQANYAASKAGQVAFAKSMAKETAKRGITVNCVSPGYIDTDLIADLPEEMKKRYREEVPMKRFGRVEEIAAATLFLASRDASYITGTVLEVTGGI